MSATQSPELKEAPAAGKAQAIRCVDCDVHQGGVGNKDLAKYMPEPHRTRALSSGGLGHLGLWNPAGVVRGDCVLADGRHASTCPEGIAEHLLDPYNIDIGILTGGMYSQGVHPDPDYGAAMCRAYNDHTIEHWLDKDERFRLAMAVSTRDAHLAAEEIRRIGAHPKVVEVIITSASTAPLGQRQFHPLYEACAEMDLPLALHPGQEGTGVATPATAAGFPTSYLEWHTGIIQTFQAHVVSMVTEGVFAKFPNLKIVLTEGGISWIVPLMWRFDKNWKALRSTAPWIDRKPSEIIQDHFFLTTQPIEEPDNHTHLKQLFEMFDARNMLLFASDFPHWDGDTPQFAVRGFDKDFQQAVLADNAVKLFKL